MKKLVKILAIVMVAALALTALYACGDNNSNTNTETTTAANGEQAPETKKLIMGTNAAFPPYEYYEGDKIIGIDAEVAALIAEKLGMELEIKDMDFNGIISAVQNGVVDMGMAGMTVNEERLLSVDFSTSYAKGVQVVIVKADSGIATLDDLADKTIGVQEATTGDIYSTDDFGEENVKRYTNGAAAVAALQSGIVDAVIIDNEPAKAFVAANDGLAILETAYAEEDYAIAVAKDNAELLGKINGALAELTADGSIQAIVDKYIPAE
ncbi:MAG: amino acid ABC transporter substrate-binding protein [Clostridia bacterium]|nr:amino acid ABC transporter substrate-binding protein [Clostridia bacterium]